MFEKKEFSYTKEDICFVAYTVSININPRIQGFLNVQMQNSPNACSVFETPNMKRYLAFKNIDIKNANVIPINFSQAPNDKEFILMEQIRIVRGLESIAVIDTEEVGLAIYVSINDALSNGWISA